MSHVQGPCAGIPTVGIGPRLFGAHRDAFCRHGHGDHHLWQVAAVIFAVLGELAERHLVGDDRTLLAGLLGLVLLGRREVDLLVRDVHLPVGRGGVDEDDVAGQVQQVRRAVEDAGRDLAERVEEEVHRRVCAVVIEARAARERDPLARPGHARQLRGRLQAALGDEREQDPLCHLAVEPAILGRSGRSAGRSKSQNRSFLEVASPRNGRAFTAATRSEIAAFSS